MKRPAFQFYPSDWRKDAAVQACSMAARGLWHEMICIAHECEPYGHLTVNGAPMTAQQLARLVGEGAKEVAGWLSELDGAGVFSRDDQGRIYSRRMVKDEHLRNVRSDAGRLGGNPALVGGKVKQVDNQPSKQSPTPSSSSSSSSSKESKTLSGKPDELPLELEKSPNGHDRPPEPAIEILDFLNFKTGRAYKPNQVNLDFIRARLKDGATVEECRMVIAKKFREWGKKDDMAEYLRPATLFNRTKFSQYQGELVEPADH